MYRLDAHHHLWRSNSSEYDWLEGDLAMLRRDFVPEDLTHATQEAGVSGTVAVQARQSVQETAWLLQLAESTPLILGVVGWLPLCAPDFPSLLGDYCAERVLKGLRHVVQAEAPGFLDNVAFNAGIRTLQGTGLAYDLLIFERQLQEAIRFVDRHPNQIFVLDHIAKPRVAAGELQPWAESIRELAERENVFCKISGMVTEADPKQWSPAQLEPYFDTVLEAFTPARLMAGWIGPCSASAAPTNAGGRFWRSGWVRSPWTSRLTSSAAPPSGPTTSMRLHPLHKIKREFLHESRYSDKPRSGPPYPNHGA